MLRKESLTPEVQFMLRFKITNEVVRLIFLYIIIIFPWNSRNISLIQNVNQYEEYGYHVISSTWCLETQLILA